MLVKIPKEIPYLSHTYRVQFTPDLIRDCGSRGCVTWHKELIELDKNMAPDTLMVSFLHENIHIIDRHSLNDHINEDDTHGLAEGLANLLTALGIQFDWQDIEEG